MNYIFPSVTDALAPGLHQSQSNMEQQQQNHTLIHGRTATAASSSAILLPPAAAVASTGENSTMPSSQLLGNTPTLDGSMNIHARKISALKEVLHKNRSYSDFLEFQIKEINQLLSMNGEKRRLVEQLEERTRETTAKASDTLPNGLIPKKAIFQSPWFVDANMNTPPDNIDTIRKRRLRGSMPISHKYISWRSEEKSQLQLAVLHQNQKYLLQRELSEVKQQFHQSGSIGSMTAAKFRELSATVAELQPEGYKLEPDDIDWNLVSSKYVHTRSPVDCKIQWCGTEDPRINQDPWTKQEDTKLIKLAEKHSAHEWIEIAKELDTNRTAMQCFQRFQRSLNSSLLLSRWQPEEDRKLIEEVKKYGDRNWAQVASKLKMRTDQQCLHRWTKSVNPAIRSGRWTEAEDLRLRLAVKAYGTKHWSKIQQHVPGRTDTKCRERWVNVLDPELTKEPFTEEEDAKLMQLVATAEHQGGVISWKKIAKELAPRTDNQCLRRWKQKVEKPILDERKKEQSFKQRLSLGGRQREKSNLTAADLRKMQGTDNVLSAGSVDQSSILSGTQGNFPLLATLPASNPDGRVLAASIPSSSTGTGDATMLPISSGQSAINNAASFAAAVQAANKASASASTIGIPSHTPAASMQPSNASTPATVANSNKSAATSSTVNPLVANAARVAAQGLFPNLPSLVGNANPFGVAQAAAAQQAQQAAALSLPMHLQMQLLAGHNNPNLALLAPILAMQQAQAQAAQGLAQQVQQVQQQQAAAAVVAAQQVAAQQVAAQQQQMKQQQQQRQREQESTQQRQREQASQQQQQQRQWTEDRQRQEQQERRQQQQQQSHDEPSHHDFLPHSHHTHEDEYSTHNDHSHSPQLLPSHPLHHPDASLDGTHPHILPHMIGDDVHSHPHDIHLSHLDSHHHTNFEVDVTGNETFHLDTIHSHETNYNTDAEHHQSNTQQQGAGVTITGKRKVVQSNESRKRTKLDSGSSHSVDFSNEPEEEQGDVEEEDE